MPLGIKVSPEIIIKAPEEILKKPMSFAGPDLAVGETITSVDSTTVIPASMGVNSAAAGTDVQVTMSGGVVGVDYVIIILASTSNGQKLVQVGRVIVRSAS